MALSKDQKKQIAAGVLGVLALLTITYSLFFSDDSRASSSAKNTGANQGKKIIPGVNAPINASNNNAAQQQEAQITLVSQPLDLDGLSGASAPVIGRNVFVYPTPPPPPPVKQTPTPPPPPPPPITLGGMDPSNRIASTPEFPLTVFGSKIPADAQILVNGAPLPSTVAGEQQVKATVPAHVIANAGAVQIEVKSASDPVKWYSNRLTMSIAAPPRPNYKYLGIIVKNGVSTAYIRDESDSELQAVKKGQRLGSRWEIVNITPTRIEIRDMQINLRQPYAIELSGEN